MIRPAAVLAFFALAAPAAAQSGAIVDPGSPSGKEYAIPLDSARRDAAGHDATAPGTASTSGTTQAPAPLFGEGVDSSAGGKSHAAARKHASSSNPSHSVTQAVAGTRSVAASVPTGNSGSTLTIIAVALAVLALGGVLGSIARRRGS